MGKGRKISDIFSSPEGRKRGEGGGRQQTASDANDCVGEKRKEKRNIAA